MRTKLDIHEIARKYDIELLLIFGSYSNGRSNARSDIDIAFLSAKDLKVEEELELLKDLIYYFGRDNIDLVNLRKATPLLLYEIASNSKVLYERDDGYLKFKIRAGARYADTKHLREKRREFLDEVLNESSGRP